MSSPSSSRKPRRLIRDGLRAWAPTLGLMGVVGWAGSRAVLAYVRILLEERGRGSR